MDLKFKSHLWGWIIPPLFIFGLFPLAVCHAWSVQPFIKSDSFIYSEPVAIKTMIFDGGKGQFSKGEQQGAWTWFEVGFRGEKLGLSFLQRYDYNIQFSKDTAELYGLIANKQDLPTGETYYVDLKAEVFHSRGVRLSYSSSFYNRLSIVTGLSYLQSDYLINGELHGTATVLAENDYDYTAKVNYQYTEDVLFDRKLEEGPEGQGFSIDIEADLRITRNWAMRLQVTDLFGRIYWKDLPFTDAVATSDRKEFDDEGYVHIDPVLEGLEGYHSRFTQHLSPRGNLRTSYSYLHCTGSVEAYYQPEYFLWALGNSIDTGFGQAVVKYWPDIHAVTLGYKRHKFEAEFTVDHVEYEKLKLFKLLISYGF